MARKLSSALVAGLVVLFSFVMRTPVQGADRWESLRSQRGPSGSYVVLDDAEVFAALDLARRGLAEVRTAVEAKRYNEAYAAWGRYWAARELPVWVFDPVAYRSALKKELPWLVPMILGEADKVLRRDLIVGTYHPKAKGRTFDWAADNGDSAYIGWHYFFWFRALPRAYLLAGDERYAQTAVEIVTDWYRSLPDIRKFEPVVWNSMLGSSLRATYFLEAYWLLRHSPALTPEVHACMLRVLLGHARYVCDRHMQRYTFWNGQNSAAAWLTAASVMLPELKESAAWRSATLPIIRQHMAQDFRGDGGQSELCEQYHMTGLRDLWTALRLMDRNGDRELIRDAAVMGKFHQALRWPLALSLPDGHTPALNSGMYATEWLIFAGLGQAFFDDPELRWALRRFVRPGWVPLQKGFPPTCFWLIDEAFGAALRDPRPVREPEFRSILLPDSGFAVLRDSWQPDASVMILDCGRPTGSHAYPGKLSLVLYLRGVPVALQPGSPLSYSLPVYGKWCYQTVSHNTIVVNDRSPRPPFFADLVHWHDLDTVVLAGAKTDVYRPTAGVSHRRLVTFLPREYFVVFDLLEGGSAGTRLSWMFHSPQPLAVDAQKRVHTPLGQRGVLLVPARPDEVLEVTQGKGHSAVPVHWTPQYRPADSYRDDVPFVGFRKQITAEAGGATYETLIAPVDKVLPPVTVRYIAPRGAAGLASGLEAIWPAHIDWHLAQEAGGKTARWDNVTCDAAHALLRFPITQTTREASHPTRQREELPTLVALAGGTMLRMGETDLLEAAGMRAVVLQRTASGWRGRVQAARGAQVRLFAPAATRAIVAGRNVPLRREGRHVVLLIEDAAIFEIQ